MIVRPGMWRDRRGAGIAEYALLLLIVVIVGALAFKFIGGGVKHAGNKTNEQFASGAGEGANGSGAGGGGSAGDKGKAGDNKAGEKTAGRSQEGTSGQGAGAAAGGGGGGGGGEGAQAGQSGQGGGGGAEDEQGGRERSTPLWKIIGGVFVLLFATGGYFAFRKQKSAG